MAVSWSVWEVKHSGQVPPVGETFGHHAGELDV